MKNTLLLSFFYVLLCSCERETPLPVSADFSITVVHNDHSVPVRVLITNTSEGADTYHWTFEGGSPEISDKRNPGTVSFHEAGNFTLQLEVENRDGSQDSKEIKISLKEKMVVDFSPEILINNFPPAEVKLHNTSIGADSYRWSFEGATTESSILQHPKNIVFKTPGTYILELEASNGLETYQKQQSITIAPFLEVGFSYRVAFEDEDLQVPVHLSMVNNSISATDFQWTISGKETITSTQVSPSFVLNDPGEYTLTLRASNGKESKTTTQTITTFPNTNLRVLEDVKLGTHLAHNTNTVGALYSIGHRKTFTKASVKEVSGSAIDLIFFGLNENFTYNKFISPHRAQDYGFDSIPGARVTKIINDLSACQCDLDKLSISDFDNMQDDSLLKNLVVEESFLEGSQEFENPLPKVLIFVLEDGRKGAIKVKDFTSNGTESYILIDIKITK